MILQALAGYYEKLAEEGKVERPGWSKAKVSFALNLGEDGKITSVIPLKQEETRGKKTVWIPQMLKVPEPVAVVRTAGISANFLCNNSGYLLGINRKGKPERAEQCFQAARDLHMEILKKCQGKAARAVMAHFENWDIQAGENEGVLAADKEELFSGVNLVFRYDGKFVQEDPEIQEAWEKYRDQNGTDEKGLCMVSGTMDEIARTHTWIRGVPGAQSSGAALVSFNAPSFESYGKKQSFNAPVGRKAMYAYTAALNYLLQEDKHRSIIGDMAVVYWAENGQTEYQDFFAEAMDLQPKNSKAEYEDLFAEMMDPQPGAEDVLNDVFKRLQRKASVDTEDVRDKLSLSECFYVLGLAPNTARLSVRFFYRDSFENILRNLEKHYKDMQICHPNGDQTKYLGIWRMLQETVNKKSRDKTPTPHMAASAFRAVLSGTPYPAALYTDALRRIRSEQDDRDNRIEKITPGRAAIIKAFLIRNNKKEVSIELNENNTNIAYVLGREFAVLEEIQEKANPGINATIKDRYFNSACTTPALVFPILFRLKNSHIKKMPNKGMEIYYERILGELQNKIVPADGQTTAYPKRMTLEEQGMFILGYYHQLQRRYRKNNKEEQENE